MVGIESWGCAYNNHLNILKTTMNKLIKFILKLPSYTSTDTIYKELNVFNFDKLFKKSVLLLIYKHRNFVPICNHNVNTRFKKNININIPRCYKSFGLKSTLNTAITLCKDLKININIFNNCNHFKYTILTLL